MSSRVTCQKYGLIEPKCIECFDRKCMGIALNVHISSNHPRNYYEKYERMWMEKCKP